MNDMLLKMNTLLVWVLDPSKRYTEPESITERKEEKNRPKEIIEKEKTLKKKNKGMLKKDSINFFILYVN
ncbi:MAG: hypothetical protein ACTSRZ_12495 [Promethearchaeota archaeon]